MTLNTMIKGRSRIHYCCNKIANANFQNNPVSHTHTQMNPDFPLQEIGPHNATIFYIWIQSTLNSKRKYTPFFDEVLKI